MTPISRRELLTSAASIAAATALLPLLPGCQSAGLAAAVPLPPPPETYVHQLFASLSEAQRAAICFPWGHPLQGAVNNNWLIVQRRVKEVLNPDQCDLVRQIFNGLHSEEYAAKVLAQVEQDNAEEGGLSGCAVALFGEPKTGKFEFVLTGRHVTRRCDGDSAPGIAFGGPIFYGHAADTFYERPNHPGSAYWFQALRMNAVLAALDGKQRAKALIAGKHPEEQGTKTVALDGDRLGIACADLSKDQKQLVETALTDLLAPFRARDTAEARRYIAAAGGVDSLSMAFWPQEDLGNDGIMDIWELRGPKMRWYCRGAPHVHMWARIEA